MLLPKGEWAKHSMGKLKLEAHLHLRYICTCMYMPLMQSVHAMQCRCPNCCLNRAVQG